MNTNQQTVWLVFQLKPNGKYEFQGVYTEKVDAIASCIGKFYCVCPATLNHAYAHETEHWDGAWYPHLEEEPKP